MTASTQRKTWLVLAASVVCQFCAVAQNLVVNSGFDTNAAGWTASNNTNGGYACCKGNPGGRFLLDSGPSPTTAPTVSQVVSGLVPGSSYAVSGDYAKLIDWGGGSATNLSFGVTLDTVLNFESRQTDFAWHTFGFQFTAASTTTTLSISAQRNGTGVAYQIDNIVVQPAPLLTARVVGPNVVVSWPTNALGFSLQSSTNLAAPNWISVTNASTISCTNYATTLNLSSGKSFFRLRK